MHAVVRGAAVWVAAACGIHRLRQPPEIPGRAAAERRSLAGIVLAEKCPNLHGRRRARLLR